jgi:hypothetical protein
MGIKKQHYRLYVAKYNCLKFPKGIHVYRKIKPSLPLIPKGLYVEMLTNHI